MIKFETKIPLQFLLILVFNIPISKGIAQTIAIVKDTHQEVVLYKDGTWEYKNSQIKNTPSNSFQKIKIPKASKHLIKSEKLPIGIWINSEKWNSIKEDEPGSPSEFRFTLKGEDAYALLISEKIEIPIDNLLDIAFNNAKKVAPDVQIVTKEKRLVKDKTIHFMQMKGTIQGIKFTYLGYYYSDSHGSLQFLTYTSQNLLENYRAEMENLLNGLTFFE